jgi:transcriptional regulator with XRE-family HTH domain
MGELETGTESYGDIAPDPEPHPGLGRAIRRLRESRGLEQHQLATKSGVAPSAISDLEEGQLDPQWSTMKRLCCGLEITLGDIAERAIELDEDEPDSGRM